MLRLLLYCTKQPLFLVRNECDGYFYTMDKGTLNDYKNVETYNGKIVAECDFEVEEIKELGGGEGLLFYTKTLDSLEIVKQACLKTEELADYLYKEYEDSKGYAIHIKNLNIFDKPRELNEFTTFTNLGEPIKRPPQNMCKVIDDLDHNCETYILISIRPEYLVKILNKEKTIEIRKKVLKEML